jgi:hypothetical protein
MSAIISSSRGSLVECRKPGAALIGPVSLVFWNGERQKLRFDLPE